MPRKTAAKPGKKSSSDEDVYEVDRILAHKMEGVSLGFGFPHSQLMMFMIEKTNVLGEVEGLVA